MCRSYFTNFASVKELVTEGAAASAPADPAMLTYRAQSW